MPRRKTGKRIKNMTIITDSAPTYKLDKNCRLDIFYYTSYDQLGAQAFPSMKHNAQILEDTFSLFNFDIFPHENATKREILNYANQISGKKDYSALFIAFSSHGLEDSIVAYDVPVQLEDILRPISASEQWRKKPKVIISEACRGGHYDLGQGPVPCVPNQSVTSNLRPEIDWMLCYATSFGNFGFTGRDNGYFIKQFCEELLNSADSCNGADLFHVMHAVNKSLVDGKGPEIWMGSCFTSTLRKMLVLKRK